MSEKNAITIFADVGNAPWAWRKDATDTSTYVGCNIADASGWCGEQTISTELEHCFIDWAKFFDSQPWYGDEDFARNFDWKKFHVQGIDLAKRLKHELGENVLIYYAKPGEDVEASEERFEILTGGELRSFLPTKFIPE